MADTVSPWLAGSGAFRLQAWSTSQLQAIVAALQQACDSWADDWGLHRSPANVQAIDNAAPPVGWLDCSAAAGESRLWIRQCPDLRTAGERAAFGADPTPVTDEIKEACRTDFRHRIQATFGLRHTRGECSRLPASLSSAWSGALQFSLGDEVRLVANAQAFRRLLGSDRDADPGEAIARREGLSRFDEALASASVDFVLELAGCEVPAATLLGLAPGDVVCLSHALDAPAQLRDSQGRNCFHGDLRRQATRRVVQLRPTAPAESSASFGEVADDR